MQQLFQLTPEEIRAFHANLKKQIANTVAQLQQLEVGLEDLRGKEIYARGMVDLLNHTEKSQRNPAIPEQKEVTDANIE